MRQRITRLPAKLKGRSKGSHAPLSFTYGIWGSISGTASILVVLWLAKVSGYPLLVGSFGASAVLLFGACESTLAQPRNFIGGHLVSAIVAVAVVEFGGSGSFAVALAVGLSIFLMYMTRTVHPPGGATALIGVQAHASCSFILLPILSGALVLLAVALFANNVVHHRQYPKYWL
jgi:CBS-domain-containing membrane protein